MGKTCASECCHHSYSASQKVCCHQEALASFQCGPGGGLHVGEQPQERWDWAQLCVLEACPLTRLMSFTSMCWSRTPATFAVSHCTSGSSGKSLEGRSTTWAPFLTGGSFSLSSAGCMPVSWQECRGWLRLPLICRFLLKEVKFRNMTPLDIDVQFHTTHFGSFGVIAEGEKRHQSDQALSTCWGDRFNHKPDTKAEWCLCL